MNNNDIEILDNNIDNNNISESNNMNNKPKKSKKGLIVIILLLLIIVGLCTFIYLKKDVLFNSGNNTNSNENNNANTNENNTNNNVVSKEEVLNDQELKKRITEKAQFMIPTEESGGGFLYDLFSKSALNSEIIISDSMKLKLVLENQKAEQEEIPIEQISDALKESNKDFFMGLISIRYILLKSIDKDYYYLFGTKIKNYDEKVQGHVDSYLYDNEKKVYYFDICCGTGIGYGTNTYINKITQKDDEIYVYISAEYYEYDDNDKKIIYSDHNKTSVVQEIINSSNYDKFSEYKLTFTKDGNDFYYKSLIRTK